MNTACHYEIYGKVRGGESGKVGGREREKVGWGESGKVGGGERVDGIRGLEQREVAEIRVERSGMQSVCEYGDFDIKTESVGYQNITLLAVAGCLHPHAERAFPQCWKGFSGRRKRLYGDMRRAFP